MFHRADELLGTGGIAAVVHRLVFGPHYGLVAFGAVRGELRRDLVPVSALGDGGHNLGDHLASPLDYHPIAYAQVLGAHVVLVMERGLPDGSAAYVHGFEHGVGIDAARPAHVEAHVEQPRHRLCGRELVGHGPARLTAHHAQVGLVVEAIDLYDHAVGGDVEILGPLHPLPVIVHGLLGRGHEVVVVADLETQFLEELQGVPVGVGHGGGLRVAERVDEHVERTGGGRARVELAQRAGRGVARVGVGGFASGDALFVEPGEQRLGEVHLATHLQP